MVATLVDRFCTLSHKDDNETRTNKESKRVEQLVDLNEASLRPKNISMAGRPTIVKAT